MLTIRRLVALGVVATTAAYVGLVAPNASANVPIRFPGQTTDRGRIELTSTSNSLTVAWYGAGTEGLMEAPLTVQRNNRCLLNSGGLAGLLDIKATVNGVSQPLGYVNNGLGVRSNNTCNTANGRFGAGQTMELALPARLTSQGIVVDRARLDIEGKFGTSLGYTRVASNGTATSVRVDNLWSGSDNGSDSGPNDNTDVWIGVEDDPSDDFVKLAITPTSADNRGQISLEAGGDYGAAAASHVTTLWLVQPGDDYEYPLGCLQTESETAGVDDDFAATTFPALADLASYPISGTIARYDNDTAPTPTGGTTPCAPIGADLSSSDLSVLLRKTTTDAKGIEQDPRLRFELVWAVPADLVGSSPDPFLRRVDLDGIDGANDSTDTFPVEDAQFCTSYTPDAREDLDPDGDGVDGLVDVDHAGSALHPADDRFANNLLSWCVISDSRVPGKLTVDINGIATNIDVIFQRVVWDGQGDPKFF